MILSPDGLTGSRTTPRRRLARGSALVPVSSRPLLADALPFQDPIDEICARPAPVFLCSAHYLVVALFVVLLVAAAMTRVDVVVIASGRLATATPPIVLQPMERAIIRDMRVHPGDAVTQGEILATLDPTFATADAGSSQEQLRSARAKLHRLEAEAEGRNFGAATAGDADDALEGVLFRQRAAEYAARLHVFDEDIARLRASQQTTADQRLALGRELGVAQSVEAMRATLWQSQIGSRLNWLEAQAARMRTERDQQEAGNRLTEIQHGLESREAERQSFIDGWRRDLLEQLVGARTEMARASAALAKAARLQDLVVVKAPADGVVLDVAQRTAGSVLREAEPLLTIVPRDATLIAEVMIASGDVGDAIPGAEVQLKIDAFPYQRHGMVSGRLASVSEESLNGFSTTDAGRGGAMHPGRIELVRTALDHLPPAARLFPGMTLTAEIKAGTRSVLAYFLYPLTRGIGESIREP